MRHHEKQTMLVIGGCRSGKSRFAEQWASGHGGRKTYVATMVASDDRELAERVLRHRRERDPDWRTVEEPCNIAALLQAPDLESDLVLVDCLTLWLTNLLLRGENDDAILAGVGELAGAIGRCPASVVLVANEVGLGIVPDTPLARRFRDLAGWCNQRIAACCDTVVFMAAGLPLFLKGSL